MDDMKTELENLFTSIFDAFAKEMPESGAVQGCIILDLLQILFKSEKNVAHAKKKRSKNLRRVVGVPPLLMFRVSPPFDHFEFCTISLLLPLRVSIKIQMMSTVEPIGFKNVFGISS
jgi:hypothetical protein